MFGVIHCHFLSFAELFSIIKEVMISPCTIFNFPESVMHGHIFMVVLLSPVQTFLRLIVWVIWSTMQLMSAFIIKFDGIEAGLTRLNECSVGFNW